MREERLLRRKVRTAREELGRSKRRRLDPDQGLVKRTSRKCGYKDSLVEGREAAGPHSPKEANRKQGF